MADPFPPFRRAIRPVGPESFPRFVEQELDKVAVALSAHREALLAGGTAGPEGPEGPQGPQGLQGPEGPQGPQGTQGPQGLKGDTGAQGPQGLKGDTGAQGPQGLKGDTGAQGPQGLQGPAGSDASVTNANVNTALAANAASSRTAIGLGNGPYMPLTGGTFSSSVKVQGLIVHQDTSGSPTAMNRWISYTDGTGAERGWFGYGEGTSRFSLTNYSGPMRFNCTDYLQVVVSGNTRLQLTNQGVIVPGLVNAADDVAAAAAGVAVNQLYRNGSALMVRVA